MPSDSAIGVSETELLTEALTSGNPFLVAAVLNSPDAAQRTLDLGLPEFGVEKLRSSVLTVSGIELSVFECAAMLDSAEFLACATKALAPFGAERLVEIVNQALDNTSWKTANLLITDELNRADVQSAAFFPKLVLDALPNTEEALAFLDRLKAPILARAGFPTNLDINSSRGTCPRVPDITSRSVREKLSLEFHLGPTLENEETFFRCAFNPMRPARFRRVLHLLRLRMLKEGRSVEEMKPVVDKYRSVFVHRCKVTNIFKFLCRNNLYEPNAALLYGILDFSWNKSSTTGAQLNLSKRFDRMEVFNALCWAITTGKGLMQFIDSYHLQEAIGLIAGQAASLNQPMAGNRGLVRVLLYFLYHRVNPIDFAVKQKVLEVGYNGFANDIYEVKCWIRWAQLQSIGGLPKEILEMIMMEKWLEFC